MSYHKQFKRGDLVQPNNILRWPQSRLPCVVITQDEFFAYLTNVLNWQISTNLYNSEHGFRGVFIKQLSTGDCGWDFPEYLDILPSWRLADEAQNRNESTS